MRTQYLTAGMLIFLAGCASSVPVAKSPSGEFRRLDPTTQKPGLVAQRESTASIVVTIEGSVSRPGLCMLPAESTVSTMFQMRDGPGFHMCVLSMVIVREEEGIVVCYSASRSNLARQQFTLRHGDRIIYLGDGI